MKFEVSWLLQSDIVASFLPLFISLMQRLSQVFNKDHIFFLRKNLSNCLRVVLKKFTVNI